jgi:nicotinamidase-related amidase
MKDGRSYEWKRRHVSFYYEGLNDLPDIDLPVGNTALLIVDIQNCYLGPEQPPAEGSTGYAEWKRWLPFYRRMDDIVIPNTGRLLERFREKSGDVLFARIACLTADGRDRSLSQSRPGFNNLLMTVNDPVSAITDRLAPLKDEIVIAKTTDSALTGTGLRLLLHNMGIRNVVVTGIFTDQCISGTVRSLADESFNVVLVEDACAAGTDTIHEQELAILNNIYCQVMNTEEVLERID